ncbi:MAG: TrkH family potassium uptake protein [bacterium]|jgi:trk system potassium uptake protein TrkH
MKIFTVIGERLSPPQIVVFSFLIPILLGTIVLRLPQVTQDGHSLSMIDAIFTATSAVCVTGLTVVDTGTFFSRFGQVIILLLIQIGGLGLMTITTLYWLLLGRRIQLRERLLVREALNLNTLAGVIRLVRAILATTFIVETLGAILLSIWFVPRVGLVQGAFFGLFHSISAFCNAGFDLLGGYRSFTAYAADSYLNIVLISLIVIGGIGFTVLMDIYRYHHSRRLSLHSNVVLVVTGGLLLVAFLGFALLEGRNPATLGHLTPGGRFFSCLFQAVTPRTAGFSTIPVAKLRQETLFFLVFFMFIGASPGSTGGGIKTATFGALLAAVWAISTGRKEIDIFQRRLSYLIVVKSLAITLIGLTVLFTTTIILSLAEEKKLLPLFFEAASAFGTVGLTTGITPHLSFWGKIIIIINMFFGRVGPLTLVLAFGQREHQSIVKYPEEKIIVG